MKALITESHSLEQARAAKLRAKKLLPTLASVVGIGIIRLDGGYGVKVNLGTPLAPGVTLPSEVDGVPVRFEVTGSIAKV